LFQIHIGRIRDSTHPQPHPAAALQKIQASPHTLFRRGHRCVSDDFRSLAYP
jgi:hypothetical protein